MLLVTRPRSAPLSFAQTDSGTALNKSSQDMTQVDEVLPVAAAQTDFAAFGVIPSGAASQHYLNTRSSSQTQHGRISTHSAGSH